MWAMRRWTVGLLLGAALLTGCASPRPEWLAREDDACFRTRDFTEQIPKAYWGDPVRDPCWRYRSIFTDP